MADKHAATYHGSDTHTCDICEEKSWSHPEPDSPHTYASGGQSSPETDEQA